MPPPRERGENGSGGLDRQAVLSDLAVQAAGGTVVVRGSGNQLLELTVADLAEAADEIARALQAEKFRATGPGRHPEGEGRAGRIWEGGAFPRPDPLSRRGSPQDDSAELVRRGQGSEGPGRDILVLGGALDDPATRALLSWATVTGAALLLETDPGNVLGTAVWARPTVFAGTVDEVVRLRFAAERHDQSWVRRLFRKLGRRPGQRPGLPFGRLRNLLVTDPGPLPQEDEAFWRERGVAVRFLPQCGIAWYISR
jgi:hypothetical protein